MKKLLVLFVLFYSISTISYGQVAMKFDSTSVSVDLHSEMYSDAKAAIVVLAEKLGTTAEFIWPVLIKQQVIDASVTLIIIGFLLLIPLFSILTAYGGKHWWEFDNDVWQGWYVAAIIFGMIWLLIASLATPSIVTGLVNPEYGAMKEVMYFIK